MATAAEIFSHSTPSYLSDEAPTNSQSVGTRIIDGAFDLADSLLRARYGDKAALPSGRYDTRGVTGAGNPTPGVDSSLWWILAIAVVVFILLRR